MKFLAEGSIGETLQRLAHKIHRDFLSAFKIENFIGKKKDFLNIFAQNIDCGYPLQLPLRGDSNEYPQSVKNQK